MKKIKLLFLMCLFTASMMAQTESDFNFLGQWTMEGTEYGSTPYCFEITMDEYGDLHAKLPASFSEKNQVVTEWQNTTVGKLKERDGYWFRQANSRYYDCYGVNHAVYYPKTRATSNKYKNYYVVIKSVEKNYLKAEAICSYESDRDYRKVEEDLGEKKFIKVKDIAPPTLIDDHQTRKKGDAGKIGEPVDLGLSVKWASWNVGASKPEDYGGFYAWGDIEEKKVYNWKNYKYCDPDMEEAIEYDGDNEKHKYFLLGKMDPETEIYSICGTKYDVARAKWGGKWRMPTKYEFYELYNKCEKYFTKLNGVKGWYFTGPNGNRIFLPSTGYIDGSDKAYDMKDWRGAACFYWTGNLITWLNSFGGYYECDGNEAFDFSLDENGVPFGNYSQRCQGLAVRPVMSDLEVVPETKAEATSTKAKAQNKSKAKASKNKKNAKKRR